MDSLRDTEEFMRAAGQVIPDAPKQPHLDVATLRLSLEWEELYEKAQAFGLEGSFQKMVMAWVIHRMPMRPEPGVWPYAENTYEYNAVAVLDACCDQRVVQDGTVLACGLKEVFPAAMAEVHRSNMSKFPKTMDEAAQTSVHYKEQGIDTVWGAEAGLWPVKRQSDGKILKSINYSPANLKPLLPCSATCPTPC